MKEKILIIGGSGFIGSHVSDEFTKKTISEKLTTYLAKPNIINLSIF